tara:strand:+ start:986 stop:1306 length:321 start_codon:yes stop_codon:yes gene_type:complete
MSGKYSKNKGYRFEAEVVNTLRSWGISEKDCFRNPLSGAVKSHKGDVNLFSMIIEAKRFKSGMLKVEKAFAQDDADIVVYRQDNGVRRWVVGDAQFKLFLEWSKLL